ncbi:hypothetical protein OEZ85_006182 [Tetradesmus obliquus]|uniref:Copper type II ascorbate-dependent monooxygenase N-terminal domain-containing protein n=1 Tax=Tetradesmus obliquus TaxID=3088 RepID=A0ABY8UFT2_TETOB|nr:hypothetical protein OEZ85_006182 [Tetradesmus obliquus]
MLKDGEGEYLCTAWLLPDKPLRLVGVDVLADPQAVDEVTVMGCEIPSKLPKEGEQQPIRAWDCNAQPACRPISVSPIHTLYAWGRDTLPLQYPRGVGYSMGAGSRIKYAVLKVHYSAGVRPRPDNTGVRLNFDNRGMPFSAGMLSYSNAAEVRPKAGHFTVWTGCCYKGFQPLTTYGVRVGRSSLGSLVYLKKGPTPFQSASHVMASGDPQLSLGLAGITGQVILPGDRLLVACEFNSLGMDANASAVNDTCSMDLAVYSALPHNEVCQADASRLFYETSPGNMKRSASLLPDPYPLWRPLQYDTVLSNQTILGNAASVTLGPDGMLWVLYRGGRVWDADAFDADFRYLFHDPITTDVVVQMHPDTGTVLRRWGSGHFYMPHMISVDRSNNVWVTDPGRQQVLKFSASGELLMEMGQFDSPGTKRIHMCQPTHVAPLNDGTFIIGDGYCNSRAVRFLADGTYHSQFQLPEKNGTYDIHNNPGGSGIGVVHSVAFDECDGMVYVADKENGRVHTFDLNTRNLTATAGLASYGKAYALAKGPYGRILALMWAPGQDAVIVDAGAPTQNWTLPNTADLAPHDLAVGPAPVALSGASERLMAVYIAPLCAGCALRKYVLFPEGFVMPDTGLPPPVLVPARSLPVVQQLESEDAEAWRERERMYQQEDREQAEQQRQMASPALLQQLQQTLEAMQQQLAAQHLAQQQLSAAAATQQKLAAQHQAVAAVVAAAAQQQAAAIEATQQQATDAADDDVIAVKGSGLGASDRTVLATIIAVLTFSAGLGALLGAFALYWLAKPGQEARASDAGGVSFPASSIATLLGAGKSMEHDKLLHSA